MDFLNNIYSKATKSKATIILPDGEDPRTLIAAEKIKLAKIAKIILLGKKKELEKISYDNGCNISGIEIIDPGEENKLSYASKMVEERGADGIVCGVLNNKTKIAKIIENTISKSKDSKFLSGIAIIISSSKEIGEEGILFFADCSVNPEPDAEELANLAISTSQLFINLLGSEPRVALLSYSTKGDCSSPNIQKILQALEIVKREKPELVIDGEVQADTALLARAANKKYPETPLEGYANILIFPNLESANIGLNLTHIFGRVVILGPIIYGVSKPVVCVSRSSTSEDIVNATALASSLTEPKEEQIEIENEEPGS